MKIEFRLPSVKEYQKLRNLVGWWPTNEISTALALENSLFSVVIIENNTVIGFGRIVGDGGLYFYLQDIIVHPNFQANKLGTTIVQELMNFVQTNARSGAFVGLMAAKGLEKYYTKFGFSARDDEAPGMYLVVK